MRKAKAKAAPSNSRQTKKVKASREADIEIEVDPVLKLEAKKKWKVSFRRALIDAVACLESDREASSEVKKLKELAFMWTDSSTGPEEKKIMFDVDGTYPWWQSYVREAGSDDDEEEEEYYEEYYEEEDKEEDKEEGGEKEEGKNTYAVENLTGSDATLVRVLKSLRDESGLPLLSVSLGRIHKVEHGTAGLSDSFNPDKYDISEPGGYYAFGEWHEESGETNVRSRDLEMNEVQTARFSFHWADGTEDGSHLTVASELIPRCDDDLKDWIHINPERESTNMQMADITKGWFPKTPSSGGGKAHLDSDGNVHGSFHHTLVCPVIVVWPFSLNSQIFTPTDAISQYLRLAQESTSPSETSALVQLAIDTAKGSLQHVDIFSTLELFCTADMTRSLEIFKEYIASRFCPLITGKNLPAFAKLVGLFSWKKISNSVLQAVDDLDSKVSSICEFANGLSEKSKIEVTKRVLKKLCRSPVLIADRPHQLMGTLFRSAILDSSLNPLFMKVARSVHKSDSSSHLVSVLNNYLLNAYKSIARKAESLPHVKQTISKCLIPHKSISGSKLSVVLELLDAVDRANDFKLFLKAGMKGTGDDIKYIMINDLFVSICTRYSDDLHKPFVSDALDACREQMRGTYWRWDTYQRKDLVISAVRAGLDELPLSVYEKLPQKQLFEILMAVPEASHNKNQVERLKSVISLQSLLPDPPSSRSWNRITGPQPTSEALRFFVRLCEDDDQVNIERVCSELIATAEPLDATSTLSKRIQLFCDEKEVISLVGRNTYVTRLFKVLLQQMKRVPKCFNNKYTNFVCKENNAIQKFFRSGERQRQFGLPTSSGIAEYRAFMKKIGGVAESKNHGKLMLGVAGHTASYSITGAGYSCNIILTKDQGIDENLVEEVGPVLERQEKWQKLPLDCPSLSTGSGNIGEI